MSLYKAKMPHKLANVRPALMNLICQFIVNEYEAGTLKVKKTKGEENTGWNIFISEKSISELISKHLLTEHNINVNKGIDGSPELDEKGFFTVNLNSAGKSVLTSNLGLHIAPAVGPD